MVGAVSPIFIYEATANYGYSIYYLIFLGFCWAMFFILFRITGRLFRSRLRKIKSRETIFNEVFKYSLWITVFLFLVGVGTYHIKMDNYEIKYSGNRAKEKRLKKLKFESSTDSLETLIEADPNNAEDCFVLGILYRTNGHSKESIDCYKNAIQRDSSISKYHSELAYSQFINDNYDEAIKQYEKAYSLDSTSKWILDRIKNVRTAKAKAEIKS